MPFKTTTFRGPFTSQPENPVLAFYWSYAIAFAKSRTTATPTDFYATSSILINTDNTVINGAQPIWDYYIQLYGPFERVEHDVVSMTVATDEESGNSTLTGEFLTYLVKKDGKGTVKLPQAFVYDIGKAEEGKGSGGLQIWAIRVYFDRGVLRQAAES